MFRLIRTPILLGLAFFAGIMAERFKTGEECAQLGGTMQGIFCERGEQ